MISWVGWWRGIVALLFGLFVGVLAASSGSADPQTSAVAARPGTHDLAHSTHRVTGGLSVPHPSTSVVLDRLDLKSAPRLHESSLATSDFGVVAETAPDYDMVARLEVISES
jgi:hypothetical protein